jgi:hypothetical protein
MELLEHTISQTAEHVRARFAFLKDSSRCHVYDGMFRSIVIDHKRCSTGKTQDHANRQQF